MGVLVGSPRQHQAMLVWAVTITTASRSSL